MRVRALRRRHGIAAYRAGEQDADAPLLGVAAAAGALGVTASTLYRWIQEGFVAVEEPAPGAPWLVRGPRKGLYVRLDEAEQPLLDGLEESSDA